MPLPQGWLCELAPLVATRLGFELLQPLLQLFVAFDVFDIARPRHARKKRWRVRLDKPAHMRMCFRKRRSHLRAIEFLPAFQNEYVGVGTNQRHYFQRSSQNVLIACKNHPAIGAHLW